MSWQMILPIIIIVTANTLYNICAKSTPAAVDPFASLTVTYLIAAVVCVILFFIFGENKNLIAELRRVNWTGYVFGATIVALEFGYIRLYREGWNISAGSLVANISLACVLVLVGILFYRESISLNRIAGIVLCVAGIVLINK